MIDEKKLIDNLIIRRERLRSIIIAIHHNNTSYADTIINEINNIIDIIDAQPKVGEWIPCSERLPEDGATVLATVSDDKILAWQPLPEPWKGERDE